MPSRLEDVHQFMNRERIAAFCTVDADCNPHVVPVFFTYCNNKVYIQSDKKSVKVCNLQKNPHVAISVYSGEFGEEVVVIRGRARIVAQDEFAKRTQEHIDKYHIHLDNQGKDESGIACFDSTVRCVVEVTADRLLFW